MASAMGFRFLEAELSVAVGRATLLGCELQGRRPGPRAGDLPRRAGVGWAPFPRETTGALQRRASGSPTHVLRSGRKSPGWGWGPCAGGPKDTEAAEMGAGQYRVGRPWPGTPAPLLSSHVALGRSLTSWCLSFLILEMGKMSVLDPQGRHDVMEGSIIT